MKPEDFSREQFLLKIPIQVSVDKIFESIATAKGLESWFLGNVEFTDDGTLSKTGIPSPKSEYHWKWQKDHETSGTVVGIEKDKRIGGESSGRKKDGSMSTYGKHVIVDHGCYTTLYAHLDTIYVRKGDILDFREYIGEVGSTGRSTGNHLHYEIRKEGVLIDPVEYL
mgnify:CR=1 FL=1